MSSNDFYLIDVLSDPDGLGLRARITAKERHDGYVVHSVAFYREFEKDGRGPTQQTSFFQPQHMPALQKLVLLAEERLRLEQEKIHERNRQKRRSVG